MPPRAMSKKKPASVKKTAAASQKKRSYGSTKTVKRSNSSSQGSRSNSSQKSRSNSQRSAKKQKRSGKVSGYNVFISLMFNCPKFEGMAYKEKYEQMGKVWRSLSENAKNKLNKVVGDAGEDWADLYAEDILPDSYVKKYFD